MGAWEFRFALVVLTALAYGDAYLAVGGSKEAVGAYRISGYALAMLMNVFIPILSPP